MKARGPYRVEYKWLDHDAEEKEEIFPTWKETCEFMKSLLDDGYEILGVSLA